MGSVWIEWVLTPSLGLAQAEKRQCRRHGFEQQRGEIEGLLRAAIQPQAADARQGQGVIQQHQQHPGGLLQTRTQQRQSQPGRAGCHRTATEYASA